MEQAHMGVVVKKDNWEYISSKGILTNQGIYHMIFLLLATFETFYLPQGVLAASREGRGGS